MTVFNRIMYELATKNVVPKMVLINTIGSSPYTIYGQIKRAQDKKLIREISYKNILGKRQCTIDCLILTPAGVRYIRDNLMKEIPWADFIGTNFDSISILGSFSNRQRIIGRFAKISAAALMADNIGANESMVFYSDFIAEETEQAKKGNDQPIDDDLEEEESDAILSPDDESIDEMLKVMLQQEREAMETESDAEVIKGIEEDDVAAPTPAKPTLSSLITEAATSYVAARDKLLDATGKQAAKRYSLSTITFYDALSIKRTVEARNKTSESKADVRGGRYAGIIDSPIRSCFVYTLTPASPMVWYERFLMRELAAMRIVKRLQTGYKHVDENPNGILLVTDPQTFEETYNAHRYIGNMKRRGVPAAKIPECGDKLSSLWVVPFSREGNAELLAIMTTDVEKEREAIVKKLLDSGDYEENLKVSRELFPIKDTFGTLVAIGTHMDVKRMKGIERMVETFHSDEPIEYAILCFQWQVPYYEAVFDNVEIIPMDDELSEYAHNWAALQPELPIEKEAELWRKMVDSRLVEPKSEGKRRRELERVLNALMMTGETPEDILKASQQYRTRMNAFHQDMGDRRT